MKNIALPALAILCLWMSGNCNAQNLPAYVPADGLIGWWPFNGNANDESGNGNDGTVNGATLTADRFGNEVSAYQFDGNESIKINENTDSQLDLTNNYTISCFIKASNFGAGFPGGARCILSKHIANQSGPNDIGGYDLKLMGPNPVYVNHQASPHFDASTQFPASNQIVEGFWTHLACTYNKTSGKLIYYKNGLISDSTTLGFNLPDNQVDLLIGASFENNTTNLAFYFRGVIDDIGYWNRALSQEEISQLYLVTGSREVQNGMNSDFRIWPVPSDGKITLHAGNLASMQGWKIKISNSLGQEVYPATLISQQQVLDLSNWGGNGLYLLHLINPQGHITEVKKIILAP